MTTEVFTPADLEAARRRVAEAEKHRDAPVIAEQAKAEKKERDAAARQAAVDAERAELDRIAAVLAEQERQAEADRIAGLRRTAEETLAKSVSALIDGDGSVEALAVHAVGALDGSVSVPGIRSEASRYLARMLGIVAAPELWDHDSDNQAFLHVGDTVFRFDRYASESELHLMHSSFGVVHVTQPDDAVTVWSSYRPQVAA